MLIVALIIVLYYKLFIIEKKIRFRVSILVEIERRLVEDQNLDVTREKSLEVLEAARNANPPASLTSCVSISLNLVLLRPSSL